MRTPVRRRSPLWVRDLDRRQLHGLTQRLINDFSTVGLSERQDWLLDACLSELSYRRRRATNPWTSCHCELCFLELEDEPADVVVERWGGSREDEQD